MDYSKVIDLDSLTLEDCIRFSTRNKYMVINDGKIVNIVVEEGYEV